MNNKFFKDSILKIIPEDLNFVVITGINGSGKGKLLDSIQSRVNQLSGKKILINMK